jgi:lipopolysaccharide/colanic/teichoic acid biosynthesis glycosyltransferase
MEADEFAAVPVACDVAPWYSRVKALLEWGIAVALLILLAPLLIALAVLVKWTSTGPVFYFQTRLGRNGHPYQIVKLRTMVHDAESWTGPVWAAKNDSRITPLGRFLRDTHLDELPQLWNVLRGDMSLIGPRPERPEITARIELRIPEFRRRLQVRPGVTGLAQMLLPADDPNDKDLDGVRKKLACDVRYLQQMSPMLDLRIALCTSCYFLVAAIDAARRNLLRSHAAALTDGLMVSPAEGECERAA